MWDRDLRKKKDNFWRKRKPNGYIYLPGSQYHKAEDYLKLGSCLQDAVINYAPSIVKYTNKLELYNKYPPRGVKDTNMIDI